jgi:hypothetical protein
MVAQYRRAARRNDHRRVRMTVGDVGVNAILVIGAIAGERGYRPRHLVKQRGDSRGIIPIVRCQLACICVHSDVQLPPGTARVGAMLLEQPAQLVTLRFCFGMW